MYFTNVNETSEKDSAQKIVAMQGEHPNIQTRIIAKGLLKEDARIICQSVNSHYKLLEALTKIESELNDESERVDQHTPQFVLNIHDIIKNARASCQ